MVVPARLSVLVVAVVVLALACGSVFAAQADETSTLAGTVKDETGAAVVGAVVTLTPAGATAVSVTTDPRGVYRFERLAEGPYLLTVTFEGFATFTREVRLRPQRETALDVILRVAGIAVSVDVGPSGGSRRGPSTFFTGADIAALPANYMPTLLKMAGATRPGEVRVFVNGAFKYNRLPDKDTIEAIRIDENTFSAEFAERGEKRIEIITTPGAGAVHGGVRLLVRDDALDARNPLVDTEPPMHFLDYNGYLLGPLVKNRVGGELYVQQSRQHENAVVNATILDPASSLSQPFSTSVPTPRRTTSMVFRTDFKLLRQLVNVSYGRSYNTAENQGLDGGLALAESAYDLASHDDGGEIISTAVGRRFVNTVQVRFSRAVAETDARLALPSVVVLDAFTSGGSQTAYHDSTNGLEASQSVAIRLASHLVMTGVRFETMAQKRSDRSGMNGSFLFGSGVERDEFGVPVVDGDGQTLALSPVETYRRTVLGLPGYGPSRFSIVVGTPAVAVRQRAASWFALDNWSVSDRLWLSYGVRVEGQEHVSRRINVAPRLSTSWEIDRGGVNTIAFDSGLFYSRVDPSIRLDTLRLNGTLQQELIVRDPLFFPAIPSLTAAQTTALSVVHTTAADLRMPSTEAVRVSYQRKLPGGLAAAAELNVERGTHLLRSRNLAAAGPGVTGAPDGPPLLQVESAGRSMSRSLGLSLWGDLRAGVSVWASYALGKNESDTDGPYTLPGSPSGYDTEFGTAADDRRHRFEAGATLRGPGGTTINPHVGFFSGVPFNITTGADNNGDTVYSDRPAFASPDDPGAVQTPYGWLTLNPATGDRIIPRNLGREQSEIVLDLVVARALPRGVRASVNLLNLLNTKTLIGSTGVLTSPRFGQPNRARNPRSANLTFSLAF